MNIRINNLEKHNIFIRIIRIITVPLLNHLPSSIIQYFMKKSSKDASTVVVRGGTTHALEVMYERYRRKLFSRGILQGLSDILWHHIVSQPKALRNRLKIVQLIIQNEVVSYIRDQNKDEISILSIAGGSSRSIIYTLQNIKSDGIHNRVHVVTIDKDESALDVGRGVAKEMGLSDNFEWIHGSARDITSIFPSRKFDIIEIVGLLDYFNVDRATRLLISSYKLMNIGGHIIIANVIPNSEKPFVYKTGWPLMYYRQPNEVENLLSSSGFDRCDIIIEPMKVHCVCVAKK